LTLVSLIIVNETPNQMM